MKYKAVFHIAGDSNRIYDCFAPEADKQKRFQLEIIKKNGEVIISVQAEDPTALKAITNSIIKLLEAYHKLEKV